jgi:hypothetical protein
MGPKLSSKSIWILEMFDEDGAQSLLWSVSNVILYSPMLHIRAKARGTIRKGQGFEAITRARNENDFAKQGSRSDPAPCFRHIALEI